MVSGIFVLSTVQRYGVFVVCANNYGIFSRKIPFY